MEKHHWDIIATVTNDLSQDQRMQRICTTLHDAGYLIMLVGRKKNNSKNFEPDTFRAHRLHCFFQKGFLFYAEFNLRLLAFLIKKKPRLVNAVDLDTVLACYLYTRLWNKNISFDAHEWFEGLPELTGRALIRTIWQWIARWTLPKIQLNYTVSGSIAKLYEKKYGTGYQVILNLPEKKVIIPKDKQQCIIIYQGVLNTGRGLEQIIELIGNHMEYHLWLVGDGDLSGKLRNQVSANGFSNIEFKGFVQPQDLHSLTCQASIGLNLLIPNSSNYYYSLANKFFDYVNAEIPSISMEFPEYKKLNEQFEVSSLISDLSNEQIWNAIQRLSIDQDYYARLKQNCIKAKQVWNWKKEETKLLQIYDKALPKI